VDIKKMAPLVFAPDTQQYFGIGRPMGQAFSVGNGLL
jgi:hypothetical protein